MTMKKKIAITGDGSWATALAYVLTQNGHNVLWHIRTPEVYESLSQKGFNSEYLRFTHFNSSKPEYTQSLSEAITRSDILLVAVPAAFIQEVFMDIPSEILKGKLLVSARRWGDFDARDHV